MSQKKKSSTGKSSRQRTDVLLEDISKKFELVLEGHAALDTKIDEFRHETRTEMGFLKLSQRVIGDNLKDLTVKVDQNFKVIREYLGRIDDEIQDLAKRLGRKADLQKLEQLQGEVAEIKLAFKKFYGKNRN